MIFALAWGLFGSRAAFVYMLSSGVSRPALDRDRPRSARRFPQCDEYRRANEHEGIFRVRQNGAHERLERLVVRAARWG